LRKYTNIEKFLDDAIIFNMKNNNVTTILDVELAREFLSRLEDEYISPEIEFCDEFDDGCTFGIDKFENSDGEVFIYVYDLFDEECEFIDYVDNEFVFVQDGVLEQLELDLVEFDEELILANIDEVEEYDFEDESYDDSFDNKNEDTEEAEECDCDSCPNKGECSLKDESDTQEKNEDFEDIIEIFTDRIIATEGCTGCIQEALEDFAEAIREFDDEDYVEEEILKTSEELEENTQNFYSDLVEMIEDGLDEIEDNCDCKDCRRENTREVFLRILDDVLKGFGITEDREVEDYTELKDRNEF